MQLLDIHVEDILFPKVFPLLHYTDWFSLRCTCKKLNEILTRFFQVNRVLYYPIPSERLLNLFTLNNNNLRVLNLPGATWLKDEQFKEIIRRNRHLKKIDLSDCQQLSQGVLQVITVKCEQLEELRLGGCGWINAEGLDYHMNHHARLKETLMDPTGETNVLAIIAQTGLRSKPHLRKKSRYAGKEKLYDMVKDDAGKKRIHHKYTKNQPVRRQGILRVLDVSKSFALADHAFRRFFNQFNKITHLSIADINQLTDTTMKYIAENLKELQMLDISDNPRISDKGLYTVAKYCPLISLVKVVNCIGITKLSTDYLMKRNIRVCIRAVRPIPQVYGQQLNHPPVIFPRVDQQSAGQQEHQAAVLPRINLPHIPSFVAAIQEEEEREAEEETRRDEDDVRPGGSRQMDYEDSEDDSFQEMD